MCSGNGHDHLGINCLDYLRNATGSIAITWIEPVYRLFTTSLSGSPRSSQSSQKLKEIETIRRLHGNVQQLFQRRFPAFKREKIIGLSSHSNEQKVPEDMLTY